MINLNEASIEQLKAVPQIGKTLSQRIYQRRVEKHFSSWMEVEELFQISSTRRRNLEKVFVIEQVDTYDNDDKSDGQGKDPADGGEDLEKVERTPKSKAVKDHTDGEDLGKVEREPKSKAVKDQADGEDCEKIERHPKSKAVIDDQVD